MRGTGGRTPRARARARASCPPPLSSPRLFYEAFQVFDELGRVMRAVDDRVPRLRGEGGEEGTGRRARARAVRRRPPPPSPPPALPPVPHLLVELGLGAQLAPKVLDDVWRRGRGRWRGGAAARRGGATTVTPPSPLPLALTLRRPLQGFGDVHGVDHVGLDAVAAALDLRGRREAAE